MVEYLIVIAIVGVAAIGAVGVFGGGVTGKTDDNRARIVEMNGSGSGPASSPAATLDAPRTSLAPAADDDGSSSTIGDFFLATGELLWGTGKGIVLAAWDTITGLVSVVWSLGEGVVWVVTHPGEAFEGLVYAVTHPGETLSATWDLGAAILSGIGTALSDAWDTMLNGTWEERGDIVGRTVFEIVLTIATGGAGHATKVRWLDKVNDLTDVAKLAKKTDDVRDKTRLVDDVNDVRRRTNVPDRIKTGLGTRIDDALERMPKLREDVDTLIADDWTIRYGEPGKGSWADRDRKEIVIEPGSTADELRTLAHETGHARYRQDAYVPPDGLSKEDYVRRNVERNLKDEGEATLRQIEARRELETSRGFLDRVFGRNRVGESRPEYERIYEDYLQHGDRDRARREIGELYANGERTSTTREPYWDYYSKEYEKIYKKYEQAQNGAE